MLANYILQQIRWTRPPNDTLKINVDGVSKSPNGMAKVGRVLSRPMGYMGGQKLRKMFFIVGRTLGSIHGAPYGLGTRSLKYYY